ncbi:Conserved protein of unknown function [Blastococcus saxobsidens DD2]|uniref:Uncharacterized protein n=1 Tax=Blastococcus saxobsidens (strain DD2) TaxID=1146883 RepID=H6RIR2_BLASD|nr:Conserved protein of unknown function [Blastococcus saxobsidens DD2]
MTGPGPRALASARERPLGRRGTGCADAAVGRLICGRGLRAGRPPDAQPEFGVYLLGRPPEPMPWDSRWVRRPDFRLPRDPAGLRRALSEAWERAALERVEVACGGGRDPRAAPVRHRLRRLRDSRTATTGTERMLRPAVGGDALGPASPG